jgi:hypothetical protein
MGKNRWILLAMILAVLVVLGLILSNAFLQPEAKFPQTAVIVDQLGTAFPNPYFVSNVTSTLQAHGFRVDYYNDSLNVDFFRSLASSNYGIVVLRAHSALRNDSSTVDLFTNEKYVVGEHQGEVDDGKLTKAEFTYVPGEYYFALSSLFVENLQGSFPHSIIIGMGCESLIRGDNPLAEAFVGKGAKAYIGWSDIVFPNDTDSETMNLLSAMLDENKTLGDAVGSTSSHSYTGSVSPTNHTIIQVESRMELYPMSSKNTTISELINQSGSSNSSLSTFAGFFLLYPILDRVGILRRRRTEI